jgi:hypothetical protein
MTTLQSLSGAQVVLLAARFISDVDVEKLQILASERRDILTIASTVYFSRYTPTTRLLDLRYWLCSGASAPISAM